MPTDDTNDVAVRQLFNSIETSFPNKRLGSERWQLLTLAAVIGLGQPSHAATLYKGLTTERPQFQTSTSRQALTRRLREVLVKCVAICGVCRPLEAILDISEIEREEDKDYSFSREHWQADEANLARGNAWLDTIYQQNRTGTIRAMDAHKDFAWISKNITYGLYLSDHSILDAIDTEIVVLTAIMTQNLPRETGWHLRGIRRVGVSKEDTEQIQKCIEEIAAFFGVHLNRVPRVADIEHEV